MIFLYLHQNMQKIFSNKTWSFMFIVILQQILQFKLLISRLLQWTKLSNNVLNVLRMICMKNWKQSTPVGSLAKCVQVVISSKKKEKVIILFVSNVHTLTIETAFESKLLSSESKLKLYEKTFKPVERKNITPKLTQKQVAKWRHFWSSTNETFRNNRNFGSLFKRNQTKIGKNFRGFCHLHPKQKRKGTGERLLSRNQCSWPGAWF